MNRLYSVFYKISRDISDSCFLKTVAHELSLFYLAGLKIHQWLYNKGWWSRAEVSCKVISIGNLVVGGTRKTPFTIFLAKFFQGLDQRLMIITRGYKSQIEAPIISDGKRIYLTPLQAGDEGYLLAKELIGIPVMKGKKRHQVIRFGFKYFLPNIIILDDAFQYYALKKDLDIVLIDANRPFGNGYLLPRGILREPISALKRAHGVIINNAENEDKTKKIKEFLKSYFPHLAIFNSLIEIKEAVLLSGQKRTISELLNLRCLVFCGLAEPANFYKTCNDLNLTIAKFLAFPDHHFYNKKDVIDLIKMAKNKKIDIFITTQKDAVKLLAFSDIFSQSGYPIFYLPLKISLNQMDGFSRWIKEKLAF